MESEPTVGLCDMGEFREPAAVAVPWPIGRKRSCGSRPACGRRASGSAIARGRGRLRRDRLRLHDSRRRQAYLRAVDPDAQPRQRQGRRHRGLRPGARRDGRLAQGSRRRLHPPGRACWIPRPAARSRRRSSSPSSTSTRAAWFRRWTTIATCRCWKSARRTWPAISSASSPTCWPASPTRKDCPRPTFASGTSKTSSSTRIRSG